MKQNKKGEKTLPFSIYKFLQILLHLAHFFFKNFFKLLIFKVCS